MNYCELYFVIILVLLCDISVQLLSEEYASLSPDTLEGLGFYTSVAKDIGLSDTQKKVFGMLACYYFHIESDRFTANTTGTVDAHLCKCDMIITSREIIEISHGFNLFTR